ncbi:MAG: hypothetical protein ACJAYI_001212, partial [Myxococcota bacterium]
AALCIAALCLAALCLRESTLELNLDANARYLAQPGWVA